MGIWYYLVNITKQEVANGPTQGNYGKFGEFDPNCWISEAQKMGWDQADTCAWISDGDDMISLPLKKPYPYDEIHGKDGFYDEALEEDWEEENVDWDDEDYYNTIVVPAREAARAARS
jgi:hypothetical protein